MVAWLAGCLVSREEGRGNGVALLLSGRLLRCVMEWNEVSSRLMWIRVKIEPESYVFILAYGPGSERSEEELEEFWSVLGVFVGMCLW